MAKDADVFLAELPAYTDEIKIEAANLLRWRAAFNTTLRQNMLGAYLGRVVYWLKTLTKLGDVVDVQPLGAAVRSLLEVATDALAVHGDSTDATAARIELWSRSAQFEAAQQVVDYYAAVGLPLPARFASLPPHLSANRGRVLTDRVFLSWNRTFQREKDRLKHPANWDYDLRTRCEALDRTPMCSSCQTGFTATEFYVENYKLTCWLVHGTGFAAFKGDVLATAKEAARMTYNVWRLADVVFTAVEHEFGMADPQVLSIAAQLRTKVRAAATYFTTEYAALK